jgi:hypothetical protein
MIKNSASECHYVQWLIFNAMCYYVEDGHAKYYSTECHCTVMMLFNDAGFFHPECHVINHTVSDTASFETAVIYKCKVFFLMCNYAECYNTGCFYSECHVIDHARNATTCNVTSESYICKKF